MSPEAAAGLRAFADVLPERTAVSGPRMRLLAVLGGTPLRHGRRARCGLAPVGPGREVGVLRLSRDVASNAVTKHGKAHGKV